MEKTMTVDEKIRRAEQIYERRKKENTRPITTVSVNEEKKDIKLLKKMFVQILVCTLIYLCIYTIQNKEYVFSEDFINKVNEILSYDTNVGEIYENIKNVVNKNHQEDKIDENAIGGSNEDGENQVMLEQEEDNQEVPNDATEQEIQSNQNDKNEQEIQIKELSDEEKVIENIKSITTFIKPLERVIISSKFGQRESDNINIPKNHTGIDIAENMGAKIKSATEGEVVLVSELGDFGKHVKIQIGEISVIYAHCNKIYVKEGERVIQGQEIAEVGNTGNSTGPHLHFEIRYLENPVDPQKILDI